MTKNNKKNIGILETHFHIKFLHTMMRICKIKETNVTVFTTKDIIDRIETYIDDKSKYEIILKKENESTSSFLKRVEMICNEKIDLLFINTIQISLIDVPHFIRFKPKCKMILTVHMINHSLKKRFAFNIKNIFRSIDVTLSIFLIKKIIIPKFNAINVIYPPIKDYILKNNIYKKKVFTIPFNFFDKNRFKINTKNDKIIKFVLPGLIETYRRDYNISLNIFKKMFEKYNKRISLYLLGQPKGNDGNRIIEKCKKLKEKGFNIYYSKKFIPEEEYDSVLNDSDIIFSPLKVLTKRNSGITEIYGKTEGSALPFEAIQYCKPLIIPDEFNIIDSLKSSTIKYKSNIDLEKIFSELIENKNKLESLKKNAYKNSKNFSLYILQNYFRDEILNKLEIL